MMATKVMSIVGIIVAGFSFLCLSAYNSAYDYEIAIGWGVIATIYLLALSIVALVQLRKAETK